MDNAYIFQHVDHTLLSPTATWGDISLLCKEAILYQTACVCIAPIYVAPVFKEFGHSLPICTVVGFPLGYNKTASKLAETEIALREGAKEIDMVINITDVKNGAFDNITSQIKALKALCGKQILKVIIETCYLNQEEKVRLCGCITEAGADFIKTSTGFGTKGATFADVTLFKEHIGANVQIKAAGGIRTREDMLAYLNLGVSRLGTSSAVKILQEEEHAQGY